VIFEDIEDTSFLAQNAADLLEQLEDIQIIQAKAVLLVKKTLRDIDEQDSDHDNLTTNFQECTTIIEVDNSSQSELGKVAEEEVTNKAKRDERQKKTSYCLSPNLETNLHLKKD
jgi:hypothetical protein